MLLVGLHRRYRRDGLAVVDQCHPPVTQIKQLGGGRFVGVHEKHGPVDFLGTIAGGSVNGRAVVFDAKWTSHRRLSLANIDVHQLRDLRAHHEAGAVAGVALCAPATATGAACWWLPWPTIAAVYAATPKGSIDPTAGGAVPFDLAWAASGREPVPVGDGWLPAALAALAAAVRP
jgi:penicillin-binding protein-related factor A (putative recombinase)